jgi:cyclophilin family peptidyl-prolyl cis-trans isomerase
MTRTFHRVVAVSTGLVLVLSACTGTTTEAEPSTTAAISIPSTTGAPTTTTTVAASSTTQAPAPAELVDVEVSGDPLSPFDPAVPDDAIGLDAPTFIGPGIDGAAVTLEADGRPKVVLFLAHWCPHCQDEVPEFQAYIDDVGFPEGTDFISVATGNDETRPNHPPDTWLLGEGWTPPAVVDDGSIGRAFGVNAFPFYVFIDVSGRVIARVGGSLEPAAVAEAMGSLEAGAVAPDPAELGAASLDAFREQPTACGSAQPEEPAELQFDAPGELDVTDGSQLTFATSCGEVVIDLDPAGAPETVAAISFLADQGYYDGTVCHRYVSGFVLQCGDPTATGRGGPGFQLPDEYPSDGFVYEAGTVAMANAGPGTTGSQFFIVTGDASFLPTTFTVLGTATLPDGFVERLDAIPLANSPSGETSAPTETIYVETAEYLPGG